MENEAAFGKRAQTQFKPIFERFSLFENLDKYEPDLAPSVQKLEYIVNEFLRVLGLVAVGVGRKELFLCRVGLGHLQNLFMNFAVEVERRKGGGALSLRRSLSEQTHNLLEGLPNGGASQNSVVLAHVETAREFIAFAKPVFAEMKLDWPQAFEEATRAHLGRTLGEKARF